MNLVKKKESLYFCYHQPLQSLHNFFFFQFQYSEFITKLFSDPASIFQNFDLELKGDFSFPRQQGKLFELRHIVQVGGFILMNFGIFLDSLCIAFSLEYYNI